MRYLLWMLPLLLVACFPNQAADTQALAKRRATREAEAATFLQKAPAVQMHNIDGNQLLVLDVPMRNDVGLTMLQKCVVWRDTVFKTSTITCPNSEIYP